MDMQRHTPYGEPVQYATAQAAFDSTRGTSVGWPSTDGSLLHATPIISGGHKSPKIMENTRPYAYYSSATLQEIARANSLLTVGYGFRDAHVNAWIDEYVRLNPNGKLAIITRRTGRDVHANTAVERFILKLTGGHRDLNWIYEPVEGGSPSTGAHGLVGGIYLVANGVPLTVDAEEAVFAYLLGGSKNDA